MFNKDALKIPENFKNIRPSLEHHEVLFKKNLVKPLHLPKLPIRHKEELLKEVYQKLESIKPNTQRGAFSLSIGNTDILEWLKINISPELIWFIMVFNTDAGLHKDVSASSRLSYYLQTADEGSLQTQFLSHDLKQVLVATSLKEDQWYLVKTDVWHGFVGKNKEKPRIILTTHLMRNILE